jgi:hypothetical protein
MGGHLLRRRRVGPNNNRLAPVLSQTSPEASAITGAFDIIGTLSLHNDSVPRPEPDELSQAL